MSIDTVNDITPRVQYVAAAAQEDFDYPFPIFEDADLVVDVDGDTQALNTDYTVTGAGDDTGGTISFVAPMVGAEVVTIYRDIAIARDTDFQQNGPFRATAINDEFDKAFLIMQELESKLGRALRLPITAVATDAETELSPLDNWLGKYVTINDQGLPEPAALSDAAMTASTIGALIYPLTTAEGLAGYTAADIDRRYPFGHMFRYKIPVDGASDCTPALNMATSVAVYASTGCSFYFPKLGTYYRFLTIPNEVTVPVRFYGDGKIATALLRDFNGSTNYDGIFRFGPTGEGGRVELMQLRSASGRSGGSLISLRGDASAAPGWVQLVDLYLTCDVGADSHNWGVYADGSLKTTGAIGIRSFFMSGCQIFGGLNGSFFGKSLVAFNATNCQTFSAGGTSGKVKVSGVSGTESFYFHWSGSTVQAIDIDNAMYTTFEVSWINGNLDTATTAAHNTVFGNVTGTITDLSTTSNIEGADGYPNKCISAKFGAGGVTAPTHAVEALGVVTGKTVGTTTKVGHVGTPFTTSCTDGLTFTFTPVTGKLFHIATSGGAACLCFADYKSATISLVSNPSSEFENSATPTAGKTGVFKSANSHVISVKNGTGSTQVYDLLELGNVGAVSDPA